MIMINLDYKSRLPIYEQIANEIERYVALQILKPKDQMPSIRELASQLGINPNTVKKAYDYLENKKVIITISTKGTFISDNIDAVITKKKEKLLIEIEEKIGELEKLGFSRKEIIDKMNKKN